MKRSEAIQIIKDIFCEVTYDNIADKRAEKVLKKLEEAGMKPPSLKNTIFHTNNTIPLKEVEDLIFSHKWEPEDEKI